jgi:hypothetical protein
MQHSRVIGSHMPLNSQLVASGFSSYGPVRETDIAACWLCRISACTGAGAGSAVGDGHHLASHIAVSLLPAAIAAMHCRACTTADFCLHTVPLAS